MDVAQSMVEQMCWHYYGGNAPTQFRFGTELIVSPILEPAGVPCRKPKRKFDSPMVFGPAGWMVVIRMHNNWREDKFTISQAQVCPEEGAEEVSNDAGIGH